MENSYAIIDEASGHLLNIVMWDGNLEKWRPPAGTRAELLSSLDISTLISAQPNAPLDQQPTTAEAWIEQQGFYGNRPTTLLYLKLKLDAVSKFSPALSAVQGWLDQMIVAGVANPNETRDDWTFSPYSFEQASGEALTILAED